MSVFSKRAGSIAKGGGAVLDDAERGLRALLHHIAQLSGEDEPSAAGRGRRLDEQDVAADRRPGEPRRHARDAGAHRDLVLEDRRPENAQKIAVRDRDRTALALRDPHGGLAQHPADLALQTANASLARVALDDSPERVIGDLDLLWLEAVRLQLAPNKIAARDLEFLVRRVAGEADDLHAVAKRTGDGVEHSWPLR